jgi:phenylacetate-CoA ligase
MVGYAARTVPFYRDYFARAGIDPREITGAAALDRLPVIDREQVRAEPRRFLTESAAARGAVPFVTSGTTGTPLEVYHDWRSLLANVAFGERERAPVIRICGGAFRPRELNVGYERSTLKKVLAFYAEHTLLPIRPDRTFASVLEPIERIAAMINAERPAVLVGYGAWIDVFFKTIAARAIPLHPPRIAVYVGEALPHGGRELIEQRFGVQVLSRYNAVEAFKIGFVCEERSGFHLHEDLCHVRIVRADGRAAAPGEPGEVVISNLVNRATVLLNYPIGDVATLSATGCGCGRTFRLLSALDGRVEDILPLADGRSLHPRAIWEVFKGDADVLQYQLTQHELQRFALKLVTVDEPAFQRALARGLPQLQRRLGPDATIDATRRSELERGPGGKFRAVATHCAKPPA